MAKVSAADTDTEQEVRMGPSRTSLDYDDEKSSHQDQVLNDLTIIQAQAQLMMRRLAAGKPIDADEASRRLNVIVDAVRRLTTAHQ
jgi:predicted house-cleaning NTP pyrophosphatase (Maf/HAM1 superfamily)